MTRHLYLALQAYGDNVVSFRLLREIAGLADLEILGTRLTRETADLVGFDAFPIRTVPLGNLAFYDIKAAGLRRAAADFLELRRVLQTLATDGTVVLFENQRRPGTHRLLQWLSGGFPYRQPRPGRSAYVDRREMLSEAFGNRIVLPFAPPIPARVPRVVIAPSAREPFREIPRDAIGHVLEYFADRGSTTCLIDPHGTYRDVYPRATNCVVARPLAEALRELRACDLIVAPDSLFLHLAYYVGVPAVAVVPQRIARDFYFAPPGTIERGLVLGFAEACDRERLRRYLDSLITPGPAPAAAATR